MRVALLSYNARERDAVGNHVAETLAFFLDRGADARVFVQDAGRLHPAVKPYAEVVARPEAAGPVRDYLASADLVVVQYAQFYELLHYLPLLAGGRPKLLLDYHGVTPPELWQGPNREALEQGVRQRGLAWCVDQVIAHSRFTSEELSTTTGLPADRVQRLGLVVDAQRFRPGERTRQLHDRLGLGDARLLLFVGRLAGNKRVPLLVEAVAKLRDERPAVHAVVVGDTSDLYAEEAERCRRLAEELHVAERVHFLGRLNDAELAETYRSAEVLVLPSRHEGFCVPVVEAMASGLPVVAARSSALPETVGGAGLTFTLDDADDLARQVCRVLTEPTTRPATKPRRVALVAFRFGADVVGGAETSLRTIGRALQAAGEHVEVFTTCTRSEGDWRNELPVGTFTDAGLTVHRFPLDAHDRDRHLEAVRRIVEADGHVTPEAEAEYLRHSIHSTPLIEALWRGDFDAIITGPYLFGLTYDVARAFPSETLLLPCFHDEPLARLRAWPEVYGAAGGLLLHSPEEQDLMQARLGVNHPNAVEIGTLLDVAEPSQPDASLTRPYLVYCGRYSRQKNVPLLLEWMDRYQREQPGRFDLVCLGQGEVPLPAVSWLHDLGRVEEGRKRAVLAGARALVQLSRQESLSLVALEAWSQQTPVLVHRECAVLAGQVARSGGGVTVGGYEEFARALDDLWSDADAWRQRGASGRHYVLQRYADAESFVARLREAIDNLRVPLRELMRRQGLKQAARFDRAAWREQFGQVVDRLLHEPARPYRMEVEVEPLQAEVRASCDARTVLVPVRVQNRGTPTVVAEGPGRTLLRSDADGRAEMTTLPGLVLPGQSATALVAVAVPSEPGDYEVALGAEQPGRWRGEPARVRLAVTRQGMSAASALAPLLDSARQALAEAQQRQCLPDGYVDVTEGWLARGKRWVKQKLLNNFKRAYVDVLSRQQSQVNGRLVLAVQQLTESCAALEHVVQGLQRRVAELEGQAEVGAECANPQAGVGGRCDRDKERTSGRELS